MHKSTGAMKPTPLPHYTEGEYAALDLPDGWHVASLVCFLGSLAARFLVRLLPRGWPEPWMRPILPGLAVLAFSLLGILFGLLGLRSAKGRGLARIALFLNVTVFVLGLLAVAAFFTILRR